MMRGAFAAAGADNVWQWHWLARHCLARSGSPARASRGSEAATPQRQASTGSGNII